MVALSELLKEAGVRGASDLHLSAGVQPKIRVDGKLKNMPYDKLTPSDTLEVLIGVMSVEQRERFEKCGEMELSFSIPNLGRYRMSAYRQRGTVALAVRIMGNDLSIAETLGIPKAFLELHRRKRGLILVSGPAGSGLSTTIAALIDRINHTEESLIITLEDPIEYLHRHDKSIVSQREINVDTESYVNALRASLRQSPDVILLGEMRDYETIDVAMTAAETGHLVFSTLHTIGAANTVDRIIDVFPANQQRQIAVQLSMVLQAVISQQLVPTVDGKQVPVFEIMTITPAIRNMIRDNKVPQIDGVVYSSNKEEMHSMDFGLLNLYKEGRITAETALSYASNPEMLKKKL